ncbi:MAG: hypothetical protein FJ137_03445 [Deltaproteobacteria bacterium]|nr:hypothetical protein [Deltaproteobacteria bacterium]
MATAAALALTLLFVPDEPRAPVVVIALQDRSDARIADVVVVPADPARGAVVAHLTGPGADGDPGLRSVPIAPPGAAVTEAVDGFVITVDDVGSWVPAPLPAAGAARGAPDPKSGRPAEKAPRAAPPSLAAPPGLAVATARSMRLFVPLAQPGRPQPASLHGVVDGLVVVFTGAALVDVAGRRPLALSVADVHDGRDGARVFDASVPIVADDLVARCGSPAAASGPGARRSLSTEPLRALQRATHLGLTAPVCIGSLVVAAGTGSRLADQPSRDRPARGVVVVR